jgi:trimeric autotransporter adhesin
MRFIQTAILAICFGPSVFAQTYTISTFAGGGLPVNISGTSATIAGPPNIAADAAGNVFFTEANQNRVLRLEAVTGILTLVAGNGTTGFSGDGGPATSAQLSAPSGVAVDPEGNLYIADRSNNRIRRVSGGVITTVAGSGAVGEGAGGFSGDNGPATSAQLDDPAGIALDSAGNLYIADVNNQRVRRVSGGVITTVAGSGPVGVGTGGFSGDNGLATSAQLGDPEDVAVDSAGNLYIADTFNNRIRKVSGGAITTVAGDGMASFSGDNGPATSAQLDGPQDVAVDSAGNLYIADEENFRIRKASNGVITTVAGGGIEYPGDNGPATSADLPYPTGVAVDFAGNLYIADTSGDLIRRVSSGVITTVAGNGNGGFSGDNGPATSAQLNLDGNAGGTTIAVDSVGNLYIADTLNNRIRKISNGVITTVAGSGPVGVGTGGFSGDNGPAASAQLNQPTGVAVDSVGNLYISEAGAIRKVSGGVITTVAGNRTVGFSGDNGPGTSAQLYLPEGLAVDSAGNVYVADLGNNRIRLLTPSTTSCSYSVSPTTWQTSAFGGSQTFTIQTAASCSWTVSNLPAWIIVSGASSASGSGTLTLVAAANSGTAFTATISIAGVSVSVTQASGQTSALTITTTSLSPATGNLSYSQNPAATGGTPPYMWSLVSGNLPAGLSLSPSGAITGTATAIGTSTFTLRVTGSASNSITQTFTITVFSGQINTSSLPHFAVGGGFVMGFYVLNSSSQPASFAISFNNDPHPVACAYARLVAAMGRHHRHGPERSRRLAGTYAARCRGGRRSHAPAPVIHNPATGHGAASQ